MKGLIFSIQPFSIHDGPGIRTSVFLKGCNLRCYWCHNPESLLPKPTLQFFSNKCIGCGACAAACPSGLPATARWTPDCKGCGECAKFCYADALHIAGRDYEKDELLTILLKDRRLYANSNGGVTFTGGEPFLQSEFLTEMLRSLAEAGIHTAVESAVCVPYETLNSALPYIRLLFCDLKGIDSEKHRRATGVGNELILSNIRRLSAAGIPLTIRTPVIPQYNDSIHDMEAIADFLLTLPEAPAYELMTFHGLCSGKYKSLGLSYGAEGLTSPSWDQMQNFAGVFRRRGLDVSIQ